MRQRSITGRPAAFLLAAVAGAAASSSALAQTVFYGENFDSAVRNQLSGDPRVTSACASQNPVFTHTPPAGWTVNNCGVPTYACRVGGCPADPGQTCSTCGPTAGFREYEGWSFMNKAFWIQQQGDQERSQFVLGIGNVAVADPDGWDDKGSPASNCGYFNAWMKTPAIDLAGVAPGSLSFTFDSSWRYEGFDDGRNASNNQTAKVRAIYTVGGVEQAPVDVLHWDSDDGANSGHGAPSPFFHADNTNEIVILDEATLQRPANATAVRFEFGLLDSGNDWWWAVDNLAVSGSTGGLFSEDFEGVTLEPPFDAIPSGCGINFCGEFTFTHDAPNGGSVSVASPASGGVPDWRGWSFVDRDFWRCASGGPNGSAFTNSSGLVAVADGDEFDDMTHEPGALDTTLTLPAIDISGRTDDVLVLSFDSSWRFEDSQTAVVTATYDDPAHTTVEVVRWESNQASSFFKADAVNERVARVLITPSDASHVTLALRYTGGNNWWWAVDNISVFEGVATVTVASNSPERNAMAVAPNTDYDPCFKPWSPTVGAAWTQSFDPAGGCPAECGRPEWRGWAVGFKDWWSTQVDNQERDQFARARGYVAIADADEWDDFPNGRSSFNAFMTTPAIPLPGAVNSASLSFDSSWRYEGFDDNCSCLPGGELLNNQTAIVRAIYTVGGVDQPAVDVLHWDSDDGANSGTGVPSPFFHADNTNEAVSIPRADLHIPAGASAVRFEYSLTNARNDWWWAVDNISFLVNGAPAFSEDFENAPNLQAPPSENPPIDQCSYFSTVAVQGGNFTTDNAGLSNCSDADDFYGFNAWVTDAWSRAVGGARREFLADTAYVSDFNARGCDGLARLVSPSYSITGLNADSLTLTFRSSWGSETGHASSVDVSYDNGLSWLPALSWTTSNKVTTGDETVSVQLHNPAGASSVRLRFNDAESGWWAISEIAVTGTVGQSCRADFNGDNFLDFFDYDDYVNCFESGNCPPGKTADYNGDGFADFFDYDDFVSGFERGC